MHHRKKWQGALIIAVIALTLYNIFPSIFYYANSLNAPIDEQRAIAISSSILNRVNALEQESKEWLGSFCKLLRVKPLDIHLDDNDPALFVLAFRTARDAALFRQAIPRAGSLIAFPPGHLFLFENQGEDDKTVVVQRRIPIHFAEEDSTRYFSSREEDGHQVLQLELQPIARALLKHLKHVLHKAWHPSHPDLRRESMPILDYETYHSLPEEQQHFGLILCAPILHKKLEDKGLKRDSVYIIAKGMQPILERIKREKQEEQFYRDIEGLQTILQANGCVGYAARDLGLPQEFAQDVLFEIRHYYRPVLQATREEFHVDGDNLFAYLKLTDLKQRLLTENRIADRIHEDLLKWRDDYQAAQLNLRELTRFDIPKPTRNALLENLLLSARKYFRGDDRKILHWGLDLSGGKLVEIELRDAQGKLVTDEKSISLSINELHERISNMGLSEVSIRREGNRISLAFPGKQALSAVELVKASKMTFHIVNEQFGPYNAELAPFVDRFLQEVWKEAHLSHRKSVEGVNEIAQKLLYGDAPEGEAYPQSEAARILYEQGLRLARPESGPLSSAFNDTLSKIVILRGNEAAQWEGQAHPLMITFAHFALEGSHLTKIQSGYDPDHGNFLSFEVMGSPMDSQKLSPRDHFHSWTARFAKSQVAGTPMERFSGGRGWRMAAILNDLVISAPELKEALRDSGLISGQFTQRAISRLEADLRAGSLSFTPHILSEKELHLLLF